MDFMKCLVIEASALHLGFLGCYGNDWVATPNLDRLATESVVFDQHFADCPELSSSRPWWQRSAATGFYTVPGAEPVEAQPQPWVRYETLSALTDFAVNVVSLLETACESEPEVLWIDGPNLAPPWRLPEDLLGVYADEEDPDAEPLADPPLGLGRLELGELDRLQTTYAAVVTYFDAQVGAVVDWLRERGQLDGLLVCVTAQCGLPLGEHDLTGIRRAWLHEELVHVPLILRLPNAAEAGLRIGALTQPVDLSGTLTAHLGLDATPGHGHALFPLVRAEKIELRPHAFSCLRVGESEEWLLRTPERALLLPVRVPADDPPRRLQLYVKPDDRWEVNDLAQRSEEETQGLETTLRTLVAATRPGSLGSPITA
jgi:arylsulfatase A-like enzyme